MIVMLYNPYTGVPRNKLDIDSDPLGLLLFEPGEPLQPAKVAVNLK